MRRDRIRDILIIDATLIAGLLILLSLYPLRIEINECDFQESAASAIRFFFGFIAALALTLFISSAILAFGVIFGGQEIESHPYQAVRKQSRVYIAIMTFTILGLSLLLSIAIGFVAYTYLDSFTTNFTRCHASLSANLQLSDEISVTKNTS